MHYNLESIDTIDSVYIQSIPGLEVFHVYILPSWWSVIALKSGYFFFSFSFHKLFVVVFLASAFVQNHYALHFLLQKDDVLFG